MPGAPKIDCHCHVVDPMRFPYRPDTPYRPSGQEIAPFDTLLRVMAMNGISHGVIVGTNSGYGEDLSPVLDALAHGEGRFVGIAVVDNAISTSALRRLRKAGMVGIAFNTTLTPPGFYDDTGDLLARLADLDMLLQIQLREDQLLRLLPLLDKSDVRVVIDHCGRPAPEKGVDQPGFSALLALGRAGRAVVKISGFSQFAHQRFPFDDVRPYVNALVDAFTPDLCVWGSDFPFLRAPERMEYASVLQLAQGFLPDAAARQKIFWETPRRIFGFNGTTVA